MFKAVHFARADEQSSEKLDGIRKFFFRHDVLWLWVVPVAAWLTQGEPDNDQAEGRDDYEAEHVYHMFAESSLTGASTLAA